MNLQQLQLKLDELKIKPSSYSLGRSFPEEQYVIEQLPDGKWLTYYAERGQKAGLKEFSTEEDACLDFLRTIERDSTCR